MRRGIPNLFKQGTQHMRGLEEAVIRNIDACKDLANITRTSMGPNGTLLVPIRGLWRAAAAAWP